MGDATTGRPDNSTFDLFDDWLARRDAGSEGNGAPAEARTGAPGEAEHQRPRPAFDNPLFADTSAEPAPEADAPDLDLVEATPEVPPARPAAISPETTPLDAEPEHDATGAELDAEAESRPSPVTPPQTGAEVGLAERGAADVPRTPGRGEVIAEPLPADASPEPEGPDTSAALVPAPETAPETAPAATTSPPADADSEPVPETKPSRYGAAAFLATRRPDVATLRTAVGNAVFAVATVAAILLAAGALIFALGGVVERSNPLVHGLLGVAGRLDLGVFDRQGGGVFAFDGRHVARKNAVANWGLATVVYLLAGRIVRRIIKP